MNVIATYYLEADDMEKAAGARAMRQALDAALNGITLEEHAKEHAELKSAIEQWGLP